MKTVAHSTSNDKHRFPDDANPDRNPGATDVPDDGIDQDCDGEDATELHGIGKYGSDSYELFYKNRVPANVGDHELQRYIKEEFYAV